MPILTLSRTLALATALFWPICVSVCCQAGAPAQTSASVAVVYAFSPLAADKTNADGAAPGALTLAHDGGLIGTARAGGAHGTGTVFRIPAGGNFTTLYSFSALQGVSATDSDGAAPLAPLVQGKDGRYYGTASAGGTAGEGTVFVLDVSGKLTTLYSFSATQGLVNTNSDGAQPAAGLIEADNMYYGVASSGGEGGQGTIFALSSDGRFKRLFSFDISTDMETNSDGGGPVGALALGSDGSFYATTAGFGQGSAGTIYKITPGGEFTLIHTFMQLDDSKDNPDGAAPSAGMTAGPDGTLYGTALLGGRHGTGTIFRIGPGGAFAVMYTFSATKGHRLTNADGAQPQGTLLLASDGNLYGTARMGGANGTGTIFRITPAGGFETLYSFSAVDKGDTNHDGANPCGPLVQGKDGTIYGTAMAGGQNGTGTIFKVDISPGAPASLHS